MTPKQFVLLAIAAVVSTVVALATFILNDTWSQGTLAGTRLFPALESDAGKVATIEIRQGGQTLTLQAKGNAWTVKERGGYPVEADKVRTLMLRLSQADLLEPKTRKSERYSLIELEDPSGKEARSRLIRLIDGRGVLLAEVIVGKRRPDAFGAGKPATYVRKIDDPQTWLASGDIDAPLAPRDWFKMQIIDTPSDKISRLSLEMDGEEPLKIERVKEGEATVGRPKFVGFPPDGKKLKDEYAADSLIRSASSIEMEDVRKASAAGANTKPAMISLETEAGLKVTYALRKDADATWLSIKASGEGEARKLAEELAARVEGWEFRISGGKAEALLKKRADLLEDKQS